MFNISCVIALGNSNTLIHTPLEMIGGITFTTDFFYHYIC